MAGWGATRQFPIRKYIKYEIKFKTKKEIQWTKRQNRQAEIKRKTKEKVHETSKTHLHRTIH